MSVEKNSGRACLHLQLAIDECRRVLICKACGRSLDPFDWICRVAGKERVLRTEVQALADHKEQLQGEIDQLRHKKLSLQASVRRYRKMEIKNSGNSQ